MKTDISTQLERARKLEERAHRLRMAILNDDKFMAGVIDGYEQIERGDTIGQAELDGELEKLYPGFNSA